MYGSHARPTAAMERHPIIASLFSTSYHIGSTKDALLTNLSTRPERVRPQARAGAARASVLGATQVRRRPRAPGLCCMPRD